MMALFAIAVLVARVGIDRLRFHPVVRHQRLITARELLRPRSLNRQRHPIGAMELRHAAERPHRVLKARAETLETLGKTERRMLPVRVRQHEVVDQVRERLAVDRHAQFGHVREVGGTQPTRRMLLREENLLGRSAGSQPVFHAPLQRPQLPVGELAGMPASQFLEERLGFPTRRRCEQLFDFAPHFGERVFACPVGPRQRLLRPLRRQPIRVPIVAARLAIHARLRRRQLQRRSFGQPDPENPNLLIRDHHARLPPGEGTRASVHTIPLLPEDQLITGLGGGEM